MIKSGNGRSDLLQSYSDERRAHATRYVSVAAKLVRSTLKTAEEYVGNIEKSADYITGKFTSICIFHLHMLRLVLNIT